MLKLRWDIETIKINDARRRSSFAFSTCTEGSVVAAVRPSLLPSWSPRSPRRCTRVLTPRPCPACPTASPGPTAPLCVSRTRRSASVSTRRASCPSPSPPARSPAAPSIRGSNWSSASGPPVGSRGPDVRPARGRGATSATASSTSLPTQTSGVDSS